MKITQTLKNKPKDKFTISVEITPPTRGNSIDSLFEIVNQIMPYEPLWIDVTSHAAGIEWIPSEENKFEKKIYRKMPGTIAICAAIEHKFNIPTVPHLLCHGYTREETEDALIDLSFLGVSNIMALRGDGSPKEKINTKSYNEHSSELVSQISNMNQGQYLSTQGHETQFEIGVACYPEKQFEAPNLDWDIKHFMAKQSAGANYAITQMFFDNQPFFEFENNIKKKIKIPIIPATKILSISKHVTSVPKFFHVNLPANLSKSLEEAKTNKDSLEAGVSWAHKQSLELIESGHNHLHFYVMKNAKPFEMLMERLK